MKKSLLLAAAMMIASATLASAQQRGDLSLAWGNCRVNGGGVSNATFACTVNTGNGPLLVGGLIGNANSNFASINSAFLYVDIFSETAALDPWWVLTDPPVTGCRPLSVWGLDMANAAGVTCDRSYWAEVGNPVQADRYFYPSYAPNHATFRMLVAVDASVAETTPQVGLGEESHIFSARLGRAQSTGAGSCAGCLSRVCLYFSQADFFQTNGDNFVIGVTGPPNTPLPGQAYVSWQLGVGETACAGTPVRNATWGSIKSLYR
jgi:hypothetical protein